jgi:hypothetical protein
MDINCTHHCIYQENGKCNLSFSLTLSNSKNNETDCPYYVEKSKENTNDYNQLT